jgi:putative transposase
LSLRDVDDLLAARGIIESYKTIRKWVGKFGTKYAASIRRDRPAPSDKWHFDELVIPNRGRKFWPWRAIDSNGDVLDIVVQSRRNTRAAKRFFRKLFKQYGRPRVVITDKLGSYNAALKSLASGIDHRRHRA